MKFEAELLTVSFVLFQVSTEMTNFYDTVYDKAMVQTISDQDKTKAAASVLKVFHETVWMYITYKILISEKFCWIFAQVKNMHNHLP